MSNMWFSRGLDQDWVDRANGFWSVLLLSVCSLGAFLARYITQPISCTAPRHFDAAMVHYMYQKCFLQPDLLRDFDPERPFVIQRVDGLTSYHLWVPLILFLQALCFKIPNVIWKLSRSSLTFNYDETVSSLEAIQVKNPEVRSALMQNAARLMNKLFQRSNVLLGILYMILKLLYLLNLIGQFIFLTILFGHLLPLKPIEKFVLDVQPHYRFYLPLDVMCLFELVQIQNVQTYQVQCQLSITELYEKMFVFLWFWMFFLAVATFINLVLWAGFLFIPFLRDGKISAYITSAPELSTASSSITHFISGFLGMDGVLLLSMISQNSSEVVAGSLSQEMFKVFLEKHNSRPNQPFSSIAGVLPQPYAPAPSASGVECVRMEPLSPGYQGTPHVVANNGPQVGHTPVEHTPVVDTPATDTPEVCNEKTGEECEPGSARNSTTDTFVVSNMDKPLINED